MNVNKRFLGDYDKAFGHAFYTHTKLQIPFKVLRGGSMVTLDNGRVQFSFSLAPKNPDFCKFMNLISCLKRDVNLYFEKNGHDFKYRREVSMRSVNVENCEKYKGKMLYCIDVNSCYWKTAYILGFIRENTYKNGVKRLTDKRLISVRKEVLTTGIGILNKTISVQEYDKNGIATKKPYIDTEYKNKYSPFWYAIINRVEYFMDELSKLDGFCFFRTDCVYCYCDSEYLEKYKDVFRKYNYEFKQFTSTIDKIEGTKIFYYDDKDNSDKTMDYTFYDIVK